MCVRNVRCLSQLMRYIFEYSSRNLNQSSYTSRPYIQPDDDVCRGYVHTHVDQVPRRQANATRRYIIMSNNA